MRRLRRHWYKSTYYEGYTCNVKVTNLFDINFFGNIIHAGVNFSSRWHESKLVSLSALLHPKLGDDMTPPGYAILGYSAFVSDWGVAVGNFVLDQKTNDTKDIPLSASPAAIDMLMQRGLPSEGQSVDWGIMCLKEPFGKLRLPLSSVGTSLGLLLCVCVHLLNQRTRVVRLNQIRTTF